MQRKGVVVPSQGWAQDELTCDAGGAYLGAQIPLEDVPSVQKEVVVRCRQAGKAVIVASHLLQSMIEYPTPTRAEARLATLPNAAPVASNHVQPAPPLPKDMSCTLLRWMWICLEPCMGVVGAWNASLPRCPSAAAKPLRKRPLGAAQATRYIAWAHGGCGTLCRCRRAGRGDPSRCMRARRGEPARQFLRRALAAGVGGARTR